MAHLEVGGDPKTGLIHVVRNDNSHKDLLISTDGAGAIDLVKQLLQTLAAHPDSGQRDHLKGLNPVGWKIEGTSKDFVVVAYELALGLPQSMALDRGQVDAVIQALQDARGASPSQ